MKNLSEMIDKEVQLIVDNIECASQIRWDSDSHREDAVRSIKAGICKILNSDMIVVYIDGHPTKFGLLK